MNQFLRGMTRAAIESFTFPEPILEIGSYQVEGQEDLVNLRQHFRGKQFQGLDMREGPGVDVVGNVENLPFEDNSLGTVVAMSTFEHVEHFWKGFDEVFRVLRPDGALLVCCPFYFHIHDYPHDYWRFTPEAYKSLLKGYPNKIIGWHGPQTRPANVWAIAFREQHPGYTDAEESSFRKLMNQYAHEPLRGLRRLRYLLGRILCGRRPFAPHLDRNRWEMVSLRAQGQLKLAA